jgi:hypothetical protein
MGVQDMDFKHKRFLDDILASGFVPTKAGRGGDDIGLLLRFDNMFTSLNPANCIDISAICGRKPTSYDPCLSPPFEKYWVEADEQVGWLVVAEEVYEQEEDRLAGIVAGQYDMMVLKSNSPNAIVDKIFHDGESIRAYVEVKSRSDYYSREKLLAFPDQSFQIDASKYTAGMAMAAFQKCAFIIIGGMVDGVSIWQLAKDGSPYKRLPSSRDVWLAEERRQKNNQTHQMVIKEMANLPLEDAEHIPDTGIRMVQ